MVDRADTEEETRLEHRVRDEVRDARVESKRRADAKQHREQSELRHRRLREQKFCIGLTQRLPTADQHRDHAGCDHPPTPHAVFGEHRRRPRQQHETRLHHRRGVQIGAHRSRRRHRARQPEVERKLRRLRERTEQEQHGGRVGDGSARRERGKLRERRGSEFHLQQTDAAEEAQSACTRREERTHRRLARRLRFVVETDEQERRNRRELPEHEHREEIGGNHEPGHRAGERHEEPDESREGRIVLEIADGICEHAEAEHADEQHHHHREPVEGERKVEAQHRQPLDDGAPRFVDADSLHHRHARRRRQDHEPHQRGRHGAAAKADEQQGSGYEVCDHRQDERH